MGWPNAAQTADVWLAGGTGLVVLRIVQGPMFRKAPRLNDWRFILAVLFFMQVVIHRAGSGARAHAYSAWVFDLLMNLTFLAQLATVVVGPRAAQLADAGSGALRDVLNLLAPTPGGRHRARRIPTQKAR